MSERPPYLVALLLAALAFSASGGIHASEEAVRAEEGKPAPTAPRQAEARIPFANSGGIRDWRPDGSEALYVQDAHGRWYRATLFGPCFDLPYSERVAFLTHGTDALDKFSAVAVRGQRCQFRSLVPSAPPPGKAKARNPHKPG